MGSISGFDYPETRVDMAIKCVKIFKEQLKGEAKTSDALASYWGHKSGKSGTFLQKLADLRRYGLITARGLKLTPLGEKIANPIGNELNESLKVMIFNISLWKKLYERLGGKMPDQKFWIMLYEVTGADREVAKSEAVKISKLYVDAITKIKIESEDMIIPQSESQSQATNFIQLTYGEIKVILPKNNKNIEIIKTTLDGLKEKTKEKKKEKK